MAVVRIPEENRTLNDEPAIAAYLAGRGIEFERWTPAVGVPQGDETLVVRDLLQGTADASATARSRSSLPNHFARSTSRRPPGSIKSASSVCRSRSALKLAAAAAVRPKAVTPRISTPSVTTIGRTSAARWAASLGSNNSHQTGAMMISGCKMISA